jgi:hypothetical protein
MNNKHILAFPRFNEFSEPATLGSGRSNMLQKLLLKEKNITPITSDDKSLFRRFFSFDAEARYSKSWAYITQAVNGHDVGYPMGLKYHNGDTLVPIGYFSRPATSHSSWHFHLVRPMGNWDRGPELVQLCRKLSLLSQEHVYVKKLDTDEANLLRHWHEFKPIEKYPWHTAAPEEDDTFDEVIVDTGQTLRLIEMSGTNQVKDHYKRFLRKKGDSVVWKLCDPSVYSDAWRVVRGFFNRLNEKPVQLSVPDDYRNMIWAPPLGTNEEDYFSYVLYIDNRPAGFCVAERLCKSTEAGVYANITLHDSFRYASEYLVVELLRKMHHAGISKVNFGGSEILGLHNFKLKFRPVVQEKKHWVVYDMQA